MQNYRKCAECEIAGNLFASEHTRNGRKFVAEALLLFVISLSARGWHAANRLSPRASSSDLSSSCGSLRFALATALDRLEH